MAVTLLTSIGVCQLNVASASEATVYKNSSNGVCATELKKEDNYEISYPVLKSGASADNIEKINAKIKKEVAKIVAGFKEHKNLNTSLDFELMRFDQNTLSFLFTYTAWDRNGNVFNNPKGLTFSLKSGEKVDLNHYFSNSEVVKRAKNGLSYVYGVKATKGLSNPDAYYVADDNNVIVIYNPSTLGKNGDKYYDIDISVVDFDAPYKPKPKHTEAISSSSKIYSGSNAEYIDKAFSGIVTGVEVCMRAEANTNSEIKGCFNQGEKVTIKAVKIGKEHNWYKVERSGNNDSYWIAAEYCKVDAPQARIKGTWVRSRDGAGLNNNVTGYFKNYEKVQVLTTKIANSHSWKMVLRNTGEIAWVSSDFCK